MYTPGGTDGKLYVPSGPVVVTYVTVPVGVVPTSVIVAPGTTGSPGFCAPLLLKSTHTVPVSDAGSQKPASTVTSVWVSVTTACPVVALGSLSLASLPMFCGVPL